MGTFWIDVISGERRDLPARLLRALLAPAAAAAGSFVRRRNLNFDTGRTRTHRAPCPVVSVGNLTVGGTGKTPFVEWIVRELRAMGRRPAVLSRGYRGRDDLNEEAALLAENCPGTAVTCNPDRVAGAADAVRTHGTDCLVLDDGFQHRRLARDLDIVLVDALRPFGTRRIFPAGILREPLSSLRRAGAIVITRSDQVSPEALDLLCEEVAGAAPGALVARAVHRPAAWFDSSGESHDPVWIEGQAVLAASGVGNPAAFEKTVADLGAFVIDTVRFGDHHHYSASDVRRLAARARGCGAQVVVTTQKDAVKLRELWPPQPPLAWLRVEMEVTFGSEPLKELLHDAMTPTNHKARADG